MSSVLSAGLTTPFTAPSAFFWCLLSAATVVDFHRTKQLSAVTRGASVRRGVRWVVLLYAIDSVLLLVLSLAANDTSKFSDVVDFASLVLEDFAEAAFLLLLLAVAAGAGIARPGLGPHRSRVLLVPAVYLVTTLAVDLAEEYVSLKDGWLADLEGGAAGVLQGSAATLFNACQVISLVALLLAWFMVFDVAQRTRAELEPQAEGILGASTTTDAAARGAAAAASSSSGNGNGLGHSIDLPAEVVLAAAERGDHTLQETYAEVSRDAGGDEPKSAADAVATRAKLTLLKRFLAGATLYVLARAAAIIVPLAVLPAPSQADAATTAASVCEDAVRLLFLAALALIFRAREDSPYLMVGGEGIGGRDDGTGVGAAGLTTELGVLRGDGRGGGGSDAGDFDEERPSASSSAAAAARLPPTRAPLFAGPRSDASPPRAKAPAIALAPPPRSPALAAAASPSSSSSSRPAAAAAVATGAAAGKAVGGVGKVDARFALDDSDSDYGGSSDKANPAPATRTTDAAPVRRDSTEEVPL